GARSRGSRHGLRPPPPSSLQAPPTRPGGTAPAEQHEPSPAGRASAPWRIDRRPHRHIDEPTPKTAERFPNPSGLAPAPACQKAQGPCPKRAEPPLRGCERTELPASGPLQTSLSRFQQTATRADVAPPSSDREG